MSFSISAKYASNQAAVHRLSMNWLRAVLRFSATSCIRIWVTCLILMESTISEKGMRGGLAEHDGEDGALELVAALVEALVLHWIFEGVVWFLFFIFFNRVLVLHLRKFEY